MLQIIRCLVSQKKQDIYNYKMYIPLEDCSVFYNYKMYIPLEDCSVFGNFVITLILLVLDNSCISRYQKQY